jgi:hypothetical protein
VFRRIAEFAADRLGLRVPPAPPTLDAEREARPQLISWAVGEGHRGMPSFLGLSLREALVQAARAGWEVQTEGWGYVIAQDPPVGSETIQGRHLTLRLGSAAH